MRSRRAITLLLLCWVAGIALVLLWRSEPSYQGRTLSDWIVQMRVRPDDTEARMAVRHLASNSIPLLLTWIKRGDRPTLRARLVEAKKGVIAFLEKHKVIKPRPQVWVLFVADHKSSYRSLAQSALEQLGPQAESAIPELIQMLGTKRPTPDEISPVAGTAYLLLPKLAPASIQPLVTSLSSTDPQVYALAVSALGEIGPQANAAIPIVQRRLADPDVNIRVQAAQVLSKLGADPSMFMATVIESLHDSDYTFLDDKLEILLRHKAQAAEGVAVLTQMLTNAANLSGPDNEYFRQQVAMALKRLQTSSP